MSLKPASTDVSIDRSVPRWTVWLSGFGVLLLFLALRWNNYNVPLTRDEGEYAYAARLLKHGLAPYEHSFLQKPPMVLYTYALSDLLAPGVFWFPRVLAAIFAALATVLLGFIARREFGPAVAFPAMWLMTPLIVLPQIEQFAANTEFFLLLPLMATIFMYVRSRQNQGKSTDWFWAGIFAATALLYKYTVLPVLAFLFLMWTLEERRAGIKFSKQSRNWLCAILGAMTAALAILVFFLARDGGKHLWECTIRFNRYYALSPALHAVSAWTRVKSLLSAWWIIAALLPCAAVIGPPPRTWFWGGMFLAACLCTGGIYFGHYYILPMPFAALHAAVGINNLARLAAKRAACSVRPLIRLFTAATVLLVCLPDVPFMLYPMERFADEKMKMWRSFLEARLVASHVSELSSPNDGVYVAGSEPEILYYSQRFSPTRFVIAYPFMIPTPLAQGFQREAIRDLEEQPPLLIVLAVSPTSWMGEKDSPKEFMVYLKNLLDRKYETVGGFVYNSKGGHWQEPLLQEPSSSPSYVLYRRKKS